MKAMLFDLKAMLSYLFAPNKQHWVSWPSLIRCRWRGHPAGVIWYKAGYEPDMRCKNCGDDLG